MSTEAERPATAREWGAQSSDDAFDPGNRPRGVILHHTAIREPALVGGGTAAETAHMRQIERLHLGRGWSGVGYHFVIMPSGRVYAGRPPWAVGAHALGRNRDSLGIALAGNFEKDTPRAAALSALELLRSDHSDPANPLTLIPHGDLTETDCPGRLLRQALAIAGEGL